MIANRTNTKTTTNTLGEIELRHLNFDDSRFALRLLATIKDSKEYTARVLHHQLITPTLDYEAFVRAPEEELRSVARAFAQNAPTMFEGLEGIDDSQLFNAFRTAIQTRFEEMTKRLAQMFEEHQQDIQDIVEGLVVISSKAVTGFQKTVAYFQRPEVLKSISDAVRFYQTQVAT